MNIRRGNYSVRAKVDVISKTTSVVKITDNKNNKVYTGFLFLSKRKQYDKFLSDLDKDIIPPNFTLYIKPKDEMSEEEIVRVIKE